jgi:hypothetical protein
MTLGGQTQGVCKAMEGSLFDKKKFPDIQPEKARILPSNHISIFKIIMGSLRFDSQAQA